MFVLIKMPISAVTYPISKLKVCLPLARPITRTLQVVRRYKPKIMFKAILES
jgi:hypothetical protein